MARHRVPTGSAPSLARVATGVAVGVGALTAALPGATAHAATGARHHIGDGDGDGDQPRAQHRRAAGYRMMTSGERQYRNGCRQGYIVDDCQLFTVSSLLHRHVDPFLGS